MALFSVVIVTAPPPGQGAEAGGAFVKIDGREVILRSVELFRLHGLGRMLKIVHADGTLFLSVIRFSLLGYFAIVNFFATGQLCEKFKAALPSPRPAETDSAADSRGN